MDKLRIDQRHKNMQAVKSSGSKIEQLLSRALWKKGYRYRKNDKSIFGKPDISIKKYKIAIFCDSEFWHGKDWNIKKTEIKSNVSFWHKKIERNIERDIEVNNELFKNGWKVLRFWGNEIEKDLVTCIAKIELAINDAERKNNN